MQITWHVTRSQRHRLARLEEASHSTSYIRVRVMHFGVNRPSTVFPRAKPHGLLQRRLANTRTQASSWLYHCNWVVDYQRLSTILRTMHAITCTCGALSLFSLLTHPYRTIVHINFIASNKIIVFYRWPRFDERMLRNSKKNAMRVTLKALAITNTRIKLRKDKLYYVSLTTCRQTSFFCR
jgi:hypothetical protein